MLNDSTIRSAKYTGGVLKLRDGNGLYLHVMPSGKYWRYDYRYAGKRRTLSMGVYPGVSLKQARFLLYDAKQSLDAGNDPSYEKQLRKAVGTDHSFQAMAEQFIEQQDWVREHRTTIENRLKKDMYPAIGQVCVTKLRPPDFIRVLRTIEARGARETAHRCKTISGQIMRYCVALGVIESDPCRDLKGALKTPRKKHYPAITDPAEFGKLLRLIDTYDQSAVVAHGLKLSPYLVLRPGELRFGQWSEIDWDQQVWNVPGPRMKRDRDHSLYLADSVIEILKSLHTITGGSELMFPSLRKKGQPFSDGTIGAALKYLGIAGDKHVPHGFRSSFSTMAYASGKFVEDVIEMQLSHMDNNKVKAAYNRGDHFEERKRLMTWWAGEVDRLRGDR